MPSLWKLPVNKIIITGFTMGTSKIIPAVSQIHFILGVSNGAS